MSPLPQTPDRTGPANLLSPDTWPAGTVWHYTTAAGLAGIIQENVLWASSTAFMNDHHELLTGTALMQQLLDHHRPYLGEGIAENVESMVRVSTINNRYTTFVACASNDPDNLTLWRNYTGNEVGFAVALDRTQSLSMRRQRLLTNEMVDALGFQDKDDRQQIRDNASHTMETFGWREAVYNRQSQMDIVWGRLRELESATVARSEGLKPERNELLIMADTSEELQTLKHYAFEHEQETRVVCTALPHAELVYVKHRPGKYGIIPYVELGLPSEEPDEQTQYPQKMNKLPIVGIAVGPTPYPEEAAAGVTELLRSHGRHNIAVIPSKVPFRR